MGGLRPGLRRVNYLLAPSIPPSDPVVEALFTTIAIFTLPAIFMLVVWVSVTVYRLYFPGAAPGYRAGGLWSGRARTRPTVCIGAREVLEARQKVQREELVRYEYLGHGDSDALPECWREDLQLRRN
jgi:hypothetical protein